mmetsp:Transcript_51914/g.92468  ORF Transcript_51914/g.92468 Transcript_51914/m.92468 type:complete len:92 (+) Transcript_51914:1385-1660(+)
MRRSASAPEQAGAASSPTPAAAVVAIGALSVPLAQHFVRVAAAAPHDSRNAAALVKCRCAPAPRAKRCECARHTRTARTTRAGEHCLVNAK